MLPTLLKVPTKETATQLTQLSPDSVMVRSTFGSVAGAS